jgi:hypothetical protein
MEHYSSQSHEKIMKRIRRVYFSRTFVQPFMLECAGLFALIGVLAFFVSLQNILSNASAEGSLPAIFNFVVIAFVKTELSVKVITLAAGLITTLVLWDVSLVIRQAARRVRQAF